MTRALLLIGAPGAGKSSILEALSSELERREIPHSALESEQLSMGWPLLPASTWTWPGKQRLIDHARDLATTIPTFPGITATISTDGASAPSIAQQLLRAFLTRA